MKVFGKLELENANANVMRPINERSTKQKRCKNNKMKNLIEIFNLILKR